MNEISANRIIFLVLNEMNPISTAKVSMWAIQDKYCHPPMLRFKFKNIDIDNYVYSNIKKIIESFSGRLKWTVMIPTDKPNCLILPAIFEKYMISKFSVALFQLDFEETKYSRLIDDAILDIPHLAILLRHSKNLIAHNS